MLYIDQNDVRKRRGEKRKVADSTVIESTKYLTQYSEDPASIIAGICKTHQLTKDFVQEFYSLITPMMFSTSLKLTIEMIEAYPNLFDEEELIRYLKNMPAKADLPALKEDYEKAKKNYEEMKAELEAKNLGEEQLAEILNQLGDFLDEDPTTIDPNNELYDYKVVGKTLHLSYASQHLEIFQNDQTKTSPMIDSDGKIVSSEDAIQILIREATDEEISQYSSAFIGISNKIDDLILMKIKDEDIKNILILSVVTRDGSNLSSSVYKYLANDMKENILGEEDVSAEDFINALADTKDLGWQIKMLRKVLDGTIKLKVVNSNSENNLLHLINALPEDQIPSLFSLQKYLPNGFTTRLCIYTFENKELSEDQLIEMYPSLKAAGAYFALKSFAKKNEFNKLLKTM